MAQQPQSQTSQIPALQPPPPGYVFPARQTLIYTVDWRVFTAGTAYFHLEQQGDVQKVTASADSVGGGDDAVSGGGQVSVRVRHQDGLLDGVQQATAGGAAAGFPVS